VKYRRRRPGFQLEHQTIVRRRIAIHIKFLATDFQVQIKKFILRPCKPLDASTLAATPQEVLVQIEDNEVSTLR
jgi:hypothetical protein